MTVDWSLRTFVRAHLPKTTQLFRRFWRHPIRSITCTLPSWSKIRDSCLTFQQWMAKTLRSVSESPFVMIRKVKRSSIREGWIDLCPRDDWAVQEFLIKHPRGIFIGRRIQYGDGTGPQKPLVEVMTSYLGLDGKAVGDQDVARFKRQTSEQKPDEFYSFSAVGLPSIRLEGLRDGTFPSLIEVQPKTVNLLLSPDEVRQVEFQISNHSPTNCSVVGGTSAVLHSSA